MTSVLLVMKVDLSLSLSLSLPLDLSTSLALSQSRRMNVLVVTKVSEYLAGPVLVVNQSLWTRGR